MICIIFLVQSFAFAMPKFLTFSASTTPMSSVSSASSVFSGASTGGSSSVVTVAETGLRQGSVMDVLQTTCKSLCLPVCK